MTIFSRTISVNVCRLFAVALTLFTLPILHAQESASPRVDSFSLINAETGQEIELYLNSAQINEVSISSDSARRISFSFNATNTRSVSIGGVSQQARTENQLPYSLLGDQNGVFEPWSPAIGVHTITVDPYSDFRLAGEKGESAVLRLTITEVVSQEPVPPVDTPTTPIGTPTRPIATSAAMMPAIMQLLLENGNSIEAALPSGNEDVCAAWDSTFPANAFTVTESDRLNLQQLLDTHDVLRLTPGDYRTNGLSQISVDSGQSIIALSPTQFPDVEVAAGATNIRLEGLRWMNLTFGRGGSIRYNCFKNFQHASVVVDGATVERNLFVAFANSNLEVDTSQNGHFSDNRFIKFNTHGVRSRVIEPGAARMPMVIKGDAARRSGGNSFLLTDAQTPPGSGYAIDGQRDISFVSVDLEAYNYSGIANPFAFQVRNTGTFRAIKSSGMNRRIDPDQNPAFDIDAERVFMTQFSASTASPVLRVGPSNDFLFSWRNKLSTSRVQDDGNSVNPLRVFAQEATGDDDSFGRIGSLNDVSFSIDNTRLTSEPRASIANPLRAALTETDTGSAPWGIPDFRPIPNPTGANWNANLDQRPDESAAIQAMINANGIAQLEPRTYYVGSTIYLNRNQGIVGAGANRTAIVALRPDFNMFELSWDNVPECVQTTSGFTLAEITLQGGLNGIFAGQPGLQVNRSIVSHVTFRNMANAGILVDGIFGWDNNALDYANFVDSPFGFVVQGAPTPDDSCYGRARDENGNIIGVLGEHASMSYIDKTVFYRNQFLRLGSAMVLNAFRANNLNGVVESSFEDNTVNAISLSGPNNGFTIASSRFVDNAGFPVISGNSDTLVVNSVFEAGRGDSMLSSSVTVEGSSFMAGTSTNAVVFGQPAVIERRVTRFLDIYNSVLEIPLGEVETPPASELNNIGGMYFNNGRLTGDSLSEFLNVVEFITNPNNEDFPNVTTFTSQHSQTVLPLLRGASSPGSQLLRGGSWEP